MRTINWLAFANYFLASYASLIANGIVIFLSIKMKNNENLKWVYFGFAVTELLLSVTTAIISMNIYKTDQGNTIVFSENLLIEILGSRFCSFVYKVIYQWQTCNFFLFIALISFSRYYFICQKKNWTKSEKFWIIPVVAIQMISFILMVVCPFAFTGFAFIDYNSTHPVVRNATFYDIHETNRIFCTIVPASSMQFISPALGFVGLFSYVVTIFCVFRLVANLRKSFRIVSPSVDGSTVEDKKFAIVAIVIQAISPLVCVFPVFVVSLLKSKANDSSSADFSWYLNNLPDHIVSWSQFIDAFAILYFMKAYRNGFVRTFRRNVQ